MGIKIGNGNRMKNTIIAEHIEGETPTPKRKIYNQHPWLFTIVVSFVVGLVLLFSFWQDIISWIEGLI
jgi:hypothetical protein